MSCIAARSLCFSAVPWTSREHQGADNCKYLASWAGLKVFCMPWVGFHVTLLSCLPAEANQSWDTHTRPLTRLLLHLHGEAATSKAVHERQKKNPSKFRDFIICVNHHRYGIFLWCSQRSKRLGGHAGVQTAFQLQHWSSSRARLRALPSPSHSSPLISTHSCSLITYASAGESSTKRCWWIAQPLFWRPQGLNSPPKYEL